MRSEIRTRVKRLLAMSSADDARGELDALYSVIDRAARRRIIKPNAAARQKARVARHVQGLAGR